MLAIEMPDSMDPDDYAKAYGPEGFAKLKAAALSAMEFQLKRLQKNYDMQNADQVVAYATAAVERIAALDNELEKERYIRLLSAQTGLSNQSLQAQMGRRPDAGMYNLPEDEQNLVKTEIDDESRLFYLLLESPKLAEKDRGCRGRALPISSIPENIFVHERTNKKRNFAYLCRNYIRVSGGLCDIWQSFGDKNAGGRRAEDYAETLLKKIKIGRLEQRRQMLQQQISQTGGAERATVIGELGR